jgi:hypothetical protein
MDEILMPKLTPSMFENTEASTDYKRTKKSDVRSIPVSENRRQICTIIKDSVMRNIDAQIEAERVKAETARINAENASKPFKEFKAKLANPRIKR